MKTREIEERLDQWLDELRLNRGGKRPAENTIIAYKRAIKDFVLFLDCTHKETATDKEVVAFKEYLQTEKKFKDNTINLKIISVNKFLKESDPEYHALETGDIAEKVLRYDPQEKGMTMTDLKRLLRWCDKLGKQKMKLIILTLFRTGIRVSELQFITVEALKEKATVIDNKGKKRTIFIPDDLIKELENYCRKEGIETGIIFHGQDKDKLISTSYIRKEMKTIAGKARINKSRVKPHQLRHLFTQEYLTHTDLSIQDVADMLGHSSTRTTEIYAHKNIDTIQSKQSQYDRELIKLLED